MTYQPRTVQYGPFVVRSPRYHVITATLRVSPVLFLKYRPAAWAGAVTQTIRPNATTTHPSRFVVLAIVIASPGTVHPKHRRSHCDRGGIQSLSSRRALEQRP